MDESLIVDLPEEQPPKIQKPLKIIQNARLEAAANRILKNITGKDEKDL